MNQKLYKLMKWADIEEIVYGESDHPKDLLGAHPVGTQTLVQAFFPGAESAKIAFADGSKNIAMEQEDENGYFAAFIPMKNADSYHYLVKYAGKTAVEMDDPYRFGPFLSAKDATAIEKGTATLIWKKMGGRITKQKGILGALFTVYAPHAISVCVTGSFNDWAANSYPMMRVAKTGLFELFVPGIQAGDQYLYEVHMAGGRSVRKADPFAQEIDTKEGIVSVLSSGTYRFHDTDWMAERAKMSIDEGGSVLRIAANELLGSDAAHYKNAIKEFILKIKKLGFQKVQISGLMPQKECDPFERHSISLFASGMNGSRICAVQELVDALHQEGIAVIGQMNLAVFSKEDLGLVAFDGQAVFEDPDSRRGYQPAFDAMQYNYGNPFVSGYLKNAVLYFINEFHLDGVCLVDLASMLYLDYGREDGNISFNLYGSNECLEAIALLRDINDLVRKECANVTMIADLDALWSGVTDLEDDYSLGFDLCINNGWKTEIEQYVRALVGYGNDKYLPLSRPLNYQYCEQYILPITQEIGESLAQAFSNGDQKDQIIKSLITYLSVLPGMTMVDYSLIAASDKMDRFIQELNSIVLEETALYAQNSVSEGFEWLHAIAGKEGVLSFVRNSEDSHLVIATNFSTRDCVFRSGVKKDGRYDVVFYSTDSKYGIAGTEPEQYLYSDGERFEEQDFSISLDLAAHSVAILKYSPYCEEDLQRMSARIAQIDEKATATRKIAQSQRQNVAKQEKEAERADQRAQDALAKARALADEAKAQMEHVWELSQLADQFESQADDYERALAEAKKKLEEVTALLKA